MNIPASIFKSWAPEWLIWTVILMVVLPSMGLFGLSSVNTAAAAGYYGIEPADVQYSMIIFYAAIASFFTLERRFFTYIAAKEYLVISTLVQVITSYVCYATHNLHMLFIFRFIQGMANCSSTSICITLIFSRLHSERAREIGYSVFYGVLLCLTPITSLFAAPLLDAYDFNIVYKVIIFSYLPGAILLFIVMNNVRFSKKFPLYQIDWASFVIYSIALCLLGYILIYGQQYYWLEDKRILGSVIAVVILFALHILRQLKLKRSYLSLKVFKYRNFKVGALLIFILYICRGALNITSVYFASVLGMDPIHVAYIMLMNILGVVIGVTLSCNLVLLKKPMRLIWIYGFTILLVFHTWMWFLFDTQADADTFYIPLIVQGLGAGMLMTPIIIFMISSVPEALGSTASATGVFFRFCGFCSSTAIINFFQLYQRNNHYNRFQDQISALNPVAVDRLNSYRQVMISRGVAPDQAAKIANGLLNRSVDAQAQLRYAMDYYLLISCLLVAIILLIALLPYLNRTVVNLASNQPASVSY